MAKTDGYGLYQLAPAAKLLGVTARWLREEAGAQRVPHLRAGRRLLFDVAQVARVLQQRAAAPSVDMSRLATATVDKMRGTQFLHRGDLKRRWNVSLNTVIRRLAEAEAAGVIRPVWFGRVVRYRPQDIEAYERRCQACEGRPAIPR